MGKGRVTRQISVLEEIACAAEASVWILYIGINVSPALYMNVMTSSDGQGLYSNTIRTIPSC